MKTRSWRWARQASPSPRGGPLTSSATWPFAWPWPIPPRRLDVTRRAYLETVGASRNGSRAVLVDNSRSVLAAVRAGRADVGLVYGSDAARAEGCRLLFCVRRLPLPIRYTAAVLRTGHCPDEARGLLDFLLSRTALGSVFEGLDFTQHAGRGPAAKRRHPLSCSPV